jgi:hypothetical protein
LTKFSTHTEVKQSERKGGVIQRDSGWEERRKTEGEEDTMEWKEARI